VSALLAILLATGCVNLEQAIRHEREEEVRQIVREEVPVIVEESIGRLAMRLAPWLLGPTGVLAVVGAKVAHKKRKNKQGVPNAA
jgi:hypothetical protein